MSKKRTLLTAICSIVAAVFLAIIGTYFSDWLHGQIGSYAIVFMLIAVLIATLIIYWPEPKKIAKQSSLDINVANVLAVRFISEGNTQSGNVALILYDMKFVNSSDENVTVKKILLRYKLGAKEHSVDSIVLLTGSVASPQGQSDSIVVHSGTNNIVLMNWKNLRLVISEHKLLVPGAVLVGSAAFVLGTKEVGDFEKMKSLKIVAVDYSDRETVKEIEVQEAWVKGAGNMTIQNRSFVIDPTGAISYAK
jgi:hypothetical protein